MTAPKLLFYFTFLILDKSAQMTNLSSSVHQEREFISANVGDNITLKCSSGSNRVRRFSWYKQPLGQKPRLMSAFYESNKNIAFNDEWKNNPRFTLEAVNGGNHLNITDLHISDTAYYYCAVSISITYKFAVGTLVSVKSSGLNIPATVYQSESETIQLGSSVTLNCAVHTGTCDGEHSVHWFRNSEESHPGLIYTHVGSNDQCVRSPNTETNTCVYNLPLKSVNSSHAGTYYCAVVSCGRILFGNGTHLDIDKEDYSHILVYFLSGALTLTTIVSFSLTVILFSIRRKIRFHSGGTSASSATNTQGPINEDNLHYAALRVNQARRSRRHVDDTLAECVYSRVKT
ncbi:MAM domain-containing glycosylphosphatidylinositol anchor protein 1-like [Labrus bergylta]|uniref:MAM domain-containing glycosylphosphatidylinositol anchor protein 1-like n=1 Tax=Labrus bergylta TaxID=56723 RepID=UPI0033140B1A